MPSLLDDDEEEAPVPPRRPVQADPPLVVPLRSRPEHCERILSSGPGLRCCHNPIAFQQEQTNLYFCTECAHYLRKLNKAKGRLITFRAV